MSYLWSFAGLAIGLFGLYSWYVETYTDSPIAALWREMGDRNDKRLFIIGGVVGV